MYQNCKFNRSHFIIVSFRRAIANKNTHQNNNKFSQKFRLRKITYRKN